MRLLGEGARIVQQMRWRAHVPRRVRAAQCRCVVGKNRMDVPPAGVHTACMTPKPPPSTQPTPATVCWHAVWPMADELEAAQGHYQCVARAIAYLQDHWAEQPGLSELAAHMAMSPTHLQRVFSRWAGVSPKRFVQHLSAEHARARLCQRESSLQVSLDAGLGSSSRLHELMVHSEALTPAQVRRAGAGVALGYGFSATPLGRALLGWTPLGLCSLAFCDADDAVLVAQAQAHWPQAHWQRDDTQAQQWAQRVFAGSAASARLPLVLRGTNFQLKVWRALLQTRWGDVLSYSELARRIDQPQACRAVGHAAGANPLAWLIPCHRVLQSSGALGGYRWGLVRKQALLALEQPPHGS